MGGLLYCSKLRLSSRLNKANYFIIRSDLLATSKLLSAQKQRRRPQRENSREMMSLSYARISLPLKAGITVHSLHWQTVNLPTWTSLNQDMFPIHTHTHMGVSHSLRLGRDLIQRQIPCFILLWVWMYICSLSAWPSLLLHRKQSSRRLNYNEISGKFITWVQVDSRSEQCRLYHQIWPESIPRCILWKWKLHITIKASNYP